MTDGYAKQMKLRYADTYRVCDADLPAQAEAIYERATKTVRCVSCSSAEHSARSTAATRGVEVLWPKRLYRRLAGDGPHSAGVIGLHERLATALPPV